MKKKIFYCSLILVICLIVALSFILCYYEQWTNLTGFLTAIGAIATALIAFRSFKDTSNATKKATEEAFIKEAINRLHNDLDKINSPNLAKGIVYNIDVRLREVQSVSINGLTEAYEQFVNEDNGKYEWLNTCYADVYTCYEFIDKSSLSDDDKQNRFKLLQNLPQDFLLCHLISLMLLNKKSSDEETVVAIMKDNTIKKYMEYKLYRRLSIYNLYNRLVNDTLKSYFDFTL